MSRQRLPERLVGGDVCLPFEESVHSRDTGEGERAWGVSSDVLSLDFCSSVFPFSPGRYYFAESSVTFKLFYAVFEIS